jgi:RND family efflux transporter MFP subunit
MNAGPAPHPSARSRRRWRFVLGLAVLLGASAAVGCHKAAPANPGSRAVDVIVTTSTPAEVVDYQDFTGRLDALMSVDVRARASGYIIKAPFKEGDFVHEGDLLFLIDPRPFKADLAQAEANLHLALAERKLQEKNVARARRLVGGGTISKEEYDQTTANWEKSAANIGAMEAAVERARINLSYTEVRAPLSGRISRRNVDPGNLVNADITALTTIVTVDPMYAYFDVDERTYLNLVESVERGEGVSFSQSAVDQLNAAAATVGLMSSPLGLPPLLAVPGLLPRQSLPVLMRLANQEDFSTVGRINFLDNRLNATTGTIRMRGVFDNPRGYLKSGLFVRIRLPIGNPYSTLLIPDEAIQSDQGRKYVFVVNNQNTVEYRPVQIGQAIHGLRAIKEGLSQNERVVVGGVQRVRPGTVVEAEDQEPAKAPPSALKDLLSSASRARNR